MGNIIKKDNNIENTQIIKEYIEYNKKKQFLLNMFGFGNSKI